MSDTEYQIALTVFFVRESCVERGELKLTIVPVKGILRRCRAAVQPGIEIRGCSDVWRTHQLIQNARRSDPSFGSP